MRFSKVQIKPKNGQERFQVQEGDVIAVQRVGNVAEAPIDGWKVDGIYCWQRKAQAGQVSFVLLHVHPIWRLQRANAVLVAQERLGYTRGLVDRNQAGFLDASMVTQVRQTYRACNAACQQEPNGRINHMCDPNDIAFEPHHVQK